MSPSALAIPERLARACAREPERQAWLAHLPERVEALRVRWGLKLGAPFEPGDGAASWVAPAVRTDGSPAVLKLGLPHMEGKHEIDGLRVWDGDGTVRLLEADASVGALLLERCQPGGSLRDLPEGEQDVVLARALKRLWRVPPSAHPFRPLAVMTEFWARSLRRHAVAASPTTDRALFMEGLRLYAELPRSADRQVLLATDLHAGNVLRAEREPWLVIDPKPFVGEPAFDATQHLLNIQNRLQHDPSGTIERFAGLLEVDAARVRAWTFARLAVGGIGGDVVARQALARRLAA